MLLPVMPHIACECIFAAADKRDVRCSIVDYGDAGIGGTVGGISDGGNHQGVRGRCADELQAHFGYLPSRAPDGGVLPPSASMQPCAVKFPPIPTLLEMDEYEAPQPTADAFEGAQAAPSAAGSAQMASDEVKDDDSERSRSLPALRRWLLG